MLNSAEPKLSKISKNAKMTTVLINISFYCCEKRKVYFDDFGAVIQI
jgi:hypothetical protein